MNSVSVALNLLRGQVLGRFGVNSDPGVHLIFMEPQNIPGVTQSLIFPFDLFPRGPLILLSKEVGSEEHFKVRLIWSLNQLVFWLVLCLALMRIRRDSHKPLQSHGSAAGEPQNQFQMSLLPLLVGETGVCWEASCMCSYPFLQHAFAMHVLPGGPLNDCTMHTQVPFGPANTSSSSVRVNYSELAGSISRNRLSHHSGSESETVLQKFVLGPQKSPAGNCSLVKSHTWPDCRRGHE